MDKRPWRKRRASAPSAWLRPSAATGAATGGPGRAWKCTQIVVGMHMKAKVVALPSANLMRPSVAQAPPDPRTLPRWWDSHLDAADVHHGFQLETARILLVASLDPDFASMSTASANLRRGWRCWPVRVGLASSWRRSDTCAGPSASPSGASHSLL